MEIRKTIKYLAVFSTFILGSCASAPPANAPAQYVTGDQTVHCLLPPRVQKLGSMVYPSRRELVFESATKCELRGGEYTVYDRSTPENSAGFYLGPAEEGDAEAQYSLGLVYESLFEPPRYADAASWYSKAAEQGHNPAQRNLAYLYEKGLGVEQDALLAMNLLRQAGDITDDLVLASQLDAAKSEAQREIENLTAMLEAQNTETAALQSQLSASEARVLEQQRDVMSAQDQLAVLMVKVEELEGEQQTSSASGGLGPEAERELSELRAQVDDQQQEIAERELAMASLRADVKAQQALLAASETKAQLQEDGLRRQLAQAQGTVSSQDQQISALSAQLAAQQAQLASLESELEKNKTLVAQGESAEGKVEQLNAQIDEQKQMLDQQSQRMTELRTQTQSMDSNSAALEQAQRELATLQQEAAEQEAAHGRLLAELAATQQMVAAGDAAGLEIERLNGIIRERDQQVAALQRDMAAQERSTEEAVAAADALQLGRDEVYAQLVALEAELLRSRSALDNLQVQLQAEQLSKSELSSEIDRLRSRADTSRLTDRQALAQLQVEIDRRDEELRNKDERITGLLREIATAESQLAGYEQDRIAKLAQRSPSPVYPNAPDVPLPPGERYALLIGNDVYENFTDLTTAESGARRLGEVLSSKYGFKTQLLVNAERRDIMDAFARMQQQLKPDDYLLIYYAGHGERDPEDLKVSYWLPVDSRADKMALASDGIESTWITQEIRAMKARHVMIIADSCYAGAMVDRPQVSMLRTDLDERRLSYLTNGRSRTVLTSGGNSPVLDRSREGSYSVFTQALIEVLDQNPNIIYGEALHAALVEMVRFNAEQLDFDQVPLFSEIRAADHGNGQFVLKSG